MDFYQSLRFCLINPFKYNRGPLRTLLEMYLICQQSDPSNIRKETYIHKFVNNLDEMSEN